jgi:hypothetical protein
MSNGSSQDSNAVTKSVKASLQKAEGIISGRRKANTSLFVTGMTTSAASTFVAGITAHKAH